MQKPNGRSISDFEPLLPAEKKLTNACRDGQQANISGARPNEPTEHNTIRATFLRFLILGGDETTPVHEKGPLLYGAWIDGMLDLHNTTTPHGVNCSLCYFNTEMNLMDANISGRLFLSGSRMHCDSDNAITADAASVSGGVFLNKGFESNRQIRFIAARIDGCFDCQCATFSSATEQCIIADGIKIRRDLLCNDGFYCSGAVSLLGADIGGNFQLRDANIKVQMGIALAVDRIRVGETVFLGPNFCTNGVVTLAGAHIGSNLNCGAGKFLSTEKESIIADRVTVSGSVFLNNGFEANSTVRLSGARIGGQLSCDGATFHAVEVPSLFAQSVAIVDGLVMRDLTKPARNVNLNGAKVGTLVDDSGAWGSGLALDGFTYDSFGGDSVADATSRIAWLNKQRSDHARDKRAFRAQPWSQLQKTLREAGDVAGARVVAIALEEHLRKIDRIGATPSNWTAWQSTPYRLICRLLHYCFGLFTGYGNRPLQLMLWLVGVWFLCGAAYWFVALPPQSVFAPSNPIVFQHSDYKACVPNSGEAKAENAKTKKADATAIVGAGNWYLCEKLREEYTGFSPLLYSLDVILPLVDLQQQRDWGPLIPTPSADWRFELVEVSWKHATRWVIWFETLFGWLASLLLVAIVSGLTKRRDE
jgi:hypothetical protein